MTAFIIERKTPKQFRLEAANAIAANDKGYSFQPMRKRDLEADRVREVMDALMFIARKLPPHRLELAKCHEAGLTDPATACILEGTTFSGRQANGRPPMVTVR